MSTLPPTERLGQVHCPSGDLLLIDFGLLRGWSGEAAPSGPEGPDGRTVDVELIGPGARAVADGLDLALVKGRHAFDLPDGGAWLRDLVRDAPGGAAVEVAVRPPVPHAERVRRWRSTISGAPSSTRTATVRPSASTSRKTGYAPSPQVVKKPVASESATAMEPDEVGVRRACASAARGATSQGGP